MCTWFVRWNVHVMIYNWGRKLVNNMTRESVLTNTKRPSSRRNSTLGYLIKPVKHMVKISHVSQHNTAQQISEWSNRKCGNITTQVHPQRGAASLASTRALAGPCMEWLNVGQAGSSRRISRSSGLRDRWRPFPGRGYNR